HDIRNEAKGGRNKNIKLHFVMSNVPNIDDEELILDRWSKESINQLGYETLAATIHHYASLALLDQEIFTATRPRSKLAHEYRDLSEVIIRDNLEDRDGALALLGDITRKADLSSTTLGVRANELEDQLDRITIAHPSDGEILYQLATIRQRQ